MSCDQIEVKEAERQILSMRVEEELRGVEDVVVSLSDIGRLPLMTPENFLPGARWEPSWEPRGRRQREKRR